MADTMTLPMPALLSSANVQRATEVMANAFSEDPLWIFILPDARTRASVLRKAFSAALLLAAESRQAHIAGEDLAGVAVWNYPGQPKTRVTPAAIGRFLRLIASPFLPSTLKVRTIFSQFDRMHKQYSRGPHYYLQTIGVAADAQGKGLASQLIRPFLQAADTRILPTYTETMTPANIGFYQHYGFEVMEQMNITGTSLSVWALLRPARG